MRRITGVKNRQCEVFAIISGTLPWPVTELALLSCRFLLLHSARDGPEVTETGNQLRRANSRGGQRLSNE